MLNSLGPNPRLVRMFMAEKNMTVPLENVDLLAGENRQEAYKKKNPAGQIPALVLDDGSVIAETVTICEYLEEKQPKPALIGSTPEERAEARMWVRRVELNATEYLYNGFRYAEGYQLFKDRMLCIPEIAPGLKKKGQEGLTFIDSQLAGKKFLCGDRITVADIVLYCAIDFTASVGQPLSPEFKNLTAWYKRMDDRPSAQSTLAPNWKELGMRV